MELAVPSFVFTLGRNFRERTASGPLDIGWRILRSLLIAAPQDWERRLEEFTWDLPHRNGRRKPSRRKWLHRRNACGVCGHCVEERQRSFVSSIDVSCGL